MTAPPSPACSTISIPCCCLQEGAKSDGNADSDCSPEVKRAKRLDSGSSACQESKCLKSSFLSDIKESGSQSSFRSVKIAKSHQDIGCNRNSSHSLPTLDFQALALSKSAQCIRGSSMENVNIVPPENIPIAFKLDNDIFDVRVKEDTELKNDRKARVMSSYYNHHKELHRLDSEEPRKCPVGDVETGKDVFKEEAVKFGLSEVTYESGEDPIRNILPAETLVGTRDNYQNWSTSNSQEDDAVISVRNSETSATPHQPGRGGDALTWISHVEKEYVNELEFSTLITLAYVRVRDLTNTINKAHTYLEEIDKETGEVNEASELRSEILAVFEQRAALALEHSKWRSEMSELYLHRKQVLANLKSQAALAERSYFALRKELEDLQNEPVISKPKRSWFSRLCGFIK